MSYLFRRPCLIQIRLTTGCAFYDSTRDGIPMTSRIEEHIMVLKDNVIYTVLEILNCGE